MALNLARPRGRLRLRAIRPRGLRAVPPDFGDVAHQIPYAFGRCGDVDGHGFVHGPTLRLIPPADRAHPAGSSGRTHSGSAWRGRTGGRGCQDDYRSGAGWSAARTRRVAVLVSPGRGRRRRDRGASAWGACRPPGRRLMIGTRTAVTTRDRLDATNSSLEKPLRREQLSPELPGYGRCSPARRNPPYVRHAGG